ncbi:phosphoenolpyruvate--protein phosphotransferase [Nosocomiicoccus massiliensis]|uniref:Phosphoenolpyruvate-protein phosphotransferase n=1 Tax=Nosocomiicoccus massiliensis TaxID=1232430 RepID=A0AAF0YNF5_9STAP|nr:phosphoenolpyruvate--protein phosphotransferase [Nosocomiicoccus massiliensis]WOS97019.1 phosphoenolpyruvate--protein phosphotransferase [Nosocomiicoccus massiliensis]
MSKLTGITVEPGIVSGKVVVIRDVNFDINKNEVDAASIWREHQRLDIAIETSKRELRVIQDNREFSISLGDEAILEAQIMMLEDPYFIEDIRDVINKGKTAEYAVNFVKEALTESFNAIEDAYLRARRNDVIDLTERIIANLLYTPRVDFSQLNSDTIIVAKELPPSITASLDKKYIKGVVLESGAKHSHTGLLLMSKGIPALFNVGDVLSYAEDSHYAILNSADGVINFSPTKEELEAIFLMKEKNEQIELTKDTYSKDHVKIRVSANVSVQSSVEEAIQYKADGAGLMRTEFMYMSHNDFPKETDENRVYESVVKALDDVTFRLLDIGGDKFLPYHPEELLDEVNPALGTRGVRFLKLHERTLRQQIRAIIRASRFGTVKIMVPMVTSVEEFLWIKNILNEEKIHLRMTDKIDLGAMIETPAAAIHVDSFAKHADFLSIGTNDLTQFLLAFDRTSPNFDLLAQSMHPSIFKVIRNVVMSGKKYDIPVSICGVLGQNLEALPILLGLGIRHISIDPNKMVEVKTRISQLKIKQLQRLRPLLAQIETEEELLSIARKLDKST